MNVEGPYVFLGRLCSGLRTDTEGRIEARADREGGMRSQSTTALE